MAREAQQVLAGGCGVEGVRRASGAWAGVQGHSLTDAVLPCPATHVWIHIVNAPLLLYSIHR